MVAFGLFHVVYGPLSDRYGRKGVLVTGLSLVVVGSLLAALAVVMQQLLGAMGAYSVGLVPH